MLNPEFEVFVRHPNPFFICGAAGNGTDQKYKAPVRHAVNPPASPPALAEIDRLFNSRAVSIREFYQKYNGCVLFQDLRGEAAGIRLFPVERWEEKTAEMREAYRDFAQDAFPCDLAGGVAVGEVPESGNYFVVPVKGPHQGRVFYLDRDGDNGEPFAQDFGAFIDRLLIDPVRLLNDKLGCYTRYSDGESDLQWIPEQYLAPDAGAEPETPSAEKGLFDWEAYRQTETRLISDMDHTERSLGSRHEAAAEVKYHLGRFYWKHGKYREAEPLLQEAMSVYEENGRKAELMQALYLLGKIACAGGRFEDAEKIYHRALTVRNRGIGAEDPETLDLMDGLCEVYLHLPEKNETAAALYRKIAAIARKTYGPDSPTEAACWNGMGILELIQGKYREAEAFFLKALSIYRAGPEQDIHWAETLNNLGVVSQYQKKPVAAEKYFLESLAATEKQGGPDHPMVASILGSLGILYKNLHRYAEAESCMFRSLDVKEKVFGPDHPSLAKGLNNLATYYQEQGNYFCAEQCFIRALSSVEKTLGKVNPDYALFLHNLGMLYKSRQRYDDADRCIGTALDIWEKTVGKDHPNYRIGMKHRRSVVEEQQQYKRVHHSK